MFIFVKNLIDKVMTQVNNKLVVITREDLKPGQQAVQSGHAVTEFIFNNISKAISWYKNSNYLVYLSVKDENCLKMYSQLFNEYSLTHSSFYEPDLNNELTAIAVEGGEITKKLTSKLSLTLKNIPVLCCENV